MLRIAGGPAPGRHIREHAGRPGGRPAALLGLSGGATTRPCESRSNRD